MSENKMHVEDAVDNKLAKALVRALLFIAPFVVTGMSGLIVWQLNEIKGTQKQQADDIKVVTGKVEVMNTKIDAGLIWRISEVERRLNQVEQAQKTP
ncbi:hypothetical protein [Pseudoxanthomonas mexicana]